MRRFIAVFLSAVYMLMIHGCVMAGDPNKKGLYDYQALYAYQNDTLTKETLKAIGQYLQAKDTLDLNSAQFQEESDGSHDSVKFDYALQLTPQNPKYTVSHQAIMQDVILIFALFPCINAVDIEFTQADYSFGRSYSREEATEVFGQDITAFGKSKKSFTKTFPTLLEAVEYHPDVMDTVDYYHAMGLDES